MRVRLTLIAALALAVPLWASCADTGGGPDTDAGFSPCDDTTADDDGDGISNGLEGCVFGRDTDNNRTPDWKDPDADGDGILDKVEAGKKTADGLCESTGLSWPCDTDKDGFPDYIDIDSDGDGIDDADEDSNGDGVLGCCIIECGKTLTAAQEKGCILTKVGDKVDGTPLVKGEEGCGPGQICKQGKCTPSISFGCSNGETNPLAQDTFGDGKLDGERGTFICREAREDRPEGRKKVQRDKNQDGDWHVAFEDGASYKELQIANPAAKEMAAIVNVDDPSSEVAAFVISKSTDKANVQDELNNILSAIQNKPPGGSGTVTIRASGSQGKSHDRYDTVKGTLIDVELSTASNVSTVRNELISTLLGRSPADLGSLPNPFGSSHSRFIVRLLTLRRFEFKRNLTGELERDKDGNPIDDGDKSNWRLMVMGAVAGRDNYQDPARGTGFIVDDFANGTALATYNDTTGTECDVGQIVRLPVADIVWVIDESGSMSDNRQDIVNNANNFFSRALASGLDFRMGVTNVVNPNSSSNAYAVGKFCSKISSNSSDDGGTDRFLLSTEQAIFSSCVNNPPGYEGGSEYGLVNAEEAVKKHLPRAPSDPAKFRSNATIAIIVATDEIPQSLSSAIGGNTRNCNLPASNQQQVDQAIKKYIDLFSGAVDPEAVAQFHMIGGTCQSTCTSSPDVGHGYIQVAQATGGQLGDICQKDLGTTLQIIIDNIAAGASPIKLEYVPISASLAVALDGVQLKRSRTNGFDYNGSNNSLTLINVAFDKGSEIIASYERWEKQLVIE